MSPRIKTAEESARRDEAMTKAALLTIVADSCAPHDLRANAEHYRRHLAEAHRVIETLQIRVAEVEAERDKVREIAAYDRSLFVTKTAAEEARLAAFRLARRKAATAAEWPLGITTMLSEEIDKIPDPAPKWNR